MAQDESILGQMQRMNEALERNLDGTAPLTHNQKRQILAAFLAVGNTLFSYDVDNDDEEQEQEQQNAAQEQGDQGRKKYMTPYLLERARSRGNYWRAVIACKNTDPAWFYKLCRLWPTEFEQLHAMLTAVDPETGEQYLRTRDERRHIAVVTTEMRLFYFLYTCANGREVEDCAGQSQISGATIRTIIDEVSTGIVKVLKDHLKPMGSDLGQMKDFAQQYWKLWQMPNCVGSLDGKHIRIRKPAEGGTRYWCYKGFSSIILFISASADLKIQYVDIGMPGSQADGAVLITSDFGQDLIHGRMLMAPPCLLPGADANEPANTIPSYFVGDQAFALRKWCMVPYALHADDSQRHFNYRLSRARRTVECVFGILAGRWRILMTCIAMEPPRVQRLVMACCHLHNWLRDIRGESAANQFDENGDEKPQDDPNDTVERNLQWRPVYDNMDTIDNVPIRRDVDERDARPIRDAIKEWMMTDAGRVPWVNPADC